MPRTAPTGRSSSASYRRGDRTAARGRAGRPSRQPGRSYVEDTLVVAVHCSRRKHRAEHGDQVPRRRFTSRSEWSCQTAPGPTSDMPGSTPRSGCPRAVDPRRSPRGWARAHVFPPAGCRERGCQPSHVTRRQEPRRPSTAAPNQCRAWATDQLQDGPAGAPKAAARPRAARPAR